MGWGTLVSIIDRLLAFLSKALAKQEQKDAQEERDNVENNPTEWFNEHFGGVQKLDDRAKQPAPETHETDNISK